MIEAIHQSTLNTALRCGEQFRRRYVNGEIIPPSIAAGRGRALHKANEINCKQKARTKIDLPADALKDAARDSYVKEFRDNGVFLSRDEQPRKHELLNQGLTDCLTMVGLYHREVAPEILPIDTERKFIIDIGLALPLAGTMDIVQAGRIDDLKGAGKSWSEGQIAKEIQPIFYSMAYEHEFDQRPEFYYHVLVALKSGPKRQVQRQVASDNQYRALLAKIHLFIHMLNSGVFPPADPTAWVCSEKYCGYYTTCPYVGNQLPKAWV
jgi:hypothetical protein